jgi:hypothetical protein
MKTLPALSVIGWLLAGCATSPRPTVTGLYHFPAEADLHHPVLQLTAAGTFAFYNSAADAAATNGTGNTGIYTLAGNKLRLTFTEATCCRFADREREELVLTAPPGGDLRVVFRDQSLVLRRDRPSPP